MGDRATADIKVRISAATLERLEAEAARHELAVSDIVRAALREYFEERAEGSAGVAQLREVAR